MKGQRVAAFGLVLLFGFVAPCAAVVYVDCNAPGPGHDGLTWDTAYLTIQEGVNLATPNGEVWVADGTYVQNVVMGVVMGEGVQLYGGFLGAEPGGYETERDQRDWVNNVASIQGGGPGSGSVVYVPYTTRVVVSGFTAESGDWGVFLNYATYCHIDNVVAVSTAKVGVYLENSSDNTVVDTVATANSDGFGLGYGTRRDTFQRIEAYANARFGIGTGHSEYTRILDSSLHHNGEQGVAVQWSRWWSIEGCLIHSNGSLGVGNDGSSYGTIKNCDIHSNPHGLWFQGLGGQDYNTVVANKIHSNTEGISCANNMRNNTILENEIYENDCGVRIYSSGGYPSYGNVFYHNDFVDNSVNALDEEDRYVNTWDDGYPSGGNYWSDYTGEDDFSGPNQDQPGSDGIGDAPYQIPGGGGDKDRYPLMSPYRHRRYVDENAPGPGHDGLTWDTAFLTIQEGVVAATPSGDVWVADGTYVENVVMGQGVELYGGFLGAEPGGYETEREQRDFVNNVTAIDGNQSGSCVVMAVDARIDGFTITNGKAEYGGGINCRYLGLTGAIANNTITGNSRGGIYCGGSSPTVTNNTITGNSAMSGGGIYCDYSSPTVTGNSITGNSGGYYGGGIYCYDSSPTVTNNAITGNSTSGGGGGISCYYSSPTVTGNTITGNTAFYGGGVHCYGHPGPWPTVSNNTITGNTAGWGGGICCEDSSPSVTSNAITQNSAGYGGGICCEFDSSPTLSHNDFWVNLPDNYYGCEPGEGDISADPLFLDPEKDNWHLSFLSPCVDAGTNYAPGLPETDWEGEPRVHDGDGDEEEPGVYATADMGADEFVPLLAVAPDPEPECQGPLFGLPPSGYPGWVWFSIPIDPDSCCGYGDCYDPETLLGFGCSGRLWRWDKYGKYSEVYHLSLSRWDLAVGESYLLRLWTEVSTPWYLGVSPYCPRTFEFKLGRMGWTWIGMPGLAELGGDEFMSSVRVQYPSDETGEYRTARQDYNATPGNWITWGWPFYDTHLQGARTFTPYAPFGSRTCYPWIGYRVWVKVGSAVDEGDPDQVTLIWPTP